MDHYILLIHGDVEPEVIGPFGDSKARDRKAKELKKEHGDNSGIFKLIVNDEFPNRIPVVDSYPAGFFDE